MSPFRRIGIFIGLFALLAITVMAQDACFCTSHHAHGVIGDCCCKAQTVDAHIRNFHPYLKKAVTTSALRYFYVNLDAPCELWDEPKMCRLPNCAVCECGPDEVPSLIQLTDAACTCSNMDAVDRTLDQPHAPHHHDSADRKQSQWVDWGSSSGSVYVDLILNPERFTGYQGGAIWQAIYAQNCFSTDRECLESRVFYRVLSGLQTSIATHLSYYYMNDSNCAPYPNITLWQQMAGRHPDRIENLYYTYMLLMRAVAVARPALLREGVFPRSGNEGEDTLARQLLDGFMQTDLLRACPQTFDERLLFKGEQRALLPLYRSAFRNISRIMNCVGCERCNLWGKVQTRGLGTALRILFGDVLSEHLTRNEIVSLLQTTHQLGESIAMTREMQARFDSEQQQQQQQQQRQQAEEQHRPSMQHTLTVAARVTPLLALTASVCVLYVVVSRSRQRAAARHSSEVNTTAKKEQ